jgi:hypothetical protein
MKYTEFRDSIRDELRRNPSGKTWKELKSSLDLPYSRPCPNWIRRLEQQIGLERSEKRGNALVWKVDQTGW